MTRTITGTVTPNGEGTTDPFIPGRTWPHKAYKVTLRYDGRTMSVPFYSGIGNTEPPTVADVLECVLSDASSAADGETFEEWAGEYGCGTGTDERRTYNAVVRQTERLRNLLGADFDNAVYGDQEENVQRLTGTVQ